MDGWAHGCTDGYKMGTWITDGFMSTWVGEWIHGWVFGYVDMCNGCNGAWMDRCRDNGHMDTCIGVWMHAQVQGGCSHG